MNSGDVHGTAPQVEVLTRIGVLSGQIRVRLWWRGDDEKVGEMTRGQVLETKLCVHSHPANDEF